MTRWSLFLQTPSSSYTTSWDSTLPALVSGSVIVSIVLSLRTLGPVFLAGIQAQDAALSGAIIMLLSVLTVAGTLISDLLLIVVDPRIKLTGSARGGGGPV